MNRTWLGLLSLGALALGACSNDTTMALDEASITARLADFDTSGEFTQINAAPFASEHAANTVSVWVSNEGLETYLGVDPTDETDTVDAFPTGTMIVKEMFDEAGTRVAFTVMVKGAEGGVPATADWWWGRYDAAGVVQESGGIGYCIDCHESNGLARTDWVGGIAPAERR
ncbi:MAG: cytochrome P460 family protein [Sandaracinaceae bacterium]